MKNAIHLCLFAAVAVAGLGLAPTQYAHGAVISAVSANPAEVTYNPPSFPPSYFLLTAEGNDDADSSGNFGSASLSFSSPAPIVLSLDAVNSTSTQQATEYVLFAAIHNQSGIDWDGIEVRLVSALADPELEFDTEAKGSGITEISLGPVIAPVWERRLVRWDQSPVLNGDAPTLTLIFDVPNSAGSSSYDFDLFFEPLFVPEPAGLSVILVALSCIAMGRRRPLLNG
jgi:hypothetical protein